MLLGYCFKDPFSGSVKGSVRVLSSFRVPFRGYNGVLGFADLGFRPGV